MIERCLNFDERPLELLIQIKDTFETPVFVLKHLKHVDKVDRDSVKLNPNEAEIDSLNSIAIKSGGYASPYLLSKKKGVYAVAVYEYKAERDDEIDITIGDRFKIIKTESGWCVVEKNGTHYWAPASCLMIDDDDDQPILASENQTVSTYESIGTAIYDYKKISPNEVSVKAGDSLKIYKKYNHWLLVECIDQKGWLPSCYVSINSKSDST